MSMMECQNCKGGLAFETNKEVFCYQCGNKIDVSREPNMRLLSFQAEEVVELILTGRYLADVSKVRERQDYKDDIDQLGGFNPIWCYAPLIKVSPLVSRLGGEFRPETFTNGEQMQRFRCEMSIPQQGMDRFAMLELVVPKTLIKVGLTHNAYAGAVVIPYIDKGMLQAVYKVICPDWYYHNLQLKRAYSGDILFPDGLVCPKAGEDE